ncbi:ABC transporter substrate-binding protein [Hahella sp. CCB-MM4]|uniref:substrate-binding periplasmic protein n=1 Tax=Hahella sp. (strain CCB-MM4) TaxID=1926491 RepID=UPI000B9C6D5B|nr:transporter substrate-binding domain-containing protein [Hahella sp. CCB-MM4]
MRPTTVFRQFMLLAIFFFALVAQAEESYIVVTGADSNPPFSGPELPQGGLITEIIREAIARMGAESQVEYLPWNHAYRRADSALVLGAYPYVKDAERLQHFFFSTPLYVTVERFFVVHDSDITFSRDSDLQGLILCRPLGYSLESVNHLIEQNVVRLWAPNDLATCFQLLAAGRVNLVPIGEETGYSVIAENFPAPDDFKVLTKPIQVNGYHLMVSKEYPHATEILQRFDDEVMGMWNEGRIAALYAKHHTALPPVEMFHLAP